MGLDGGTIPTRGELVQVKKKPEQKDKAADVAHKWNNCTITQTPLQVPIVVCHLGMLFNKKSILEMLLGKLNLSGCIQFHHIESLRDVRQLQLTNNRLQDASSASYVCPITGLEMNGKHRFVCLWKCGCVLSERAIKEVPSEQCHKCGTEYTSSDVVLINPSDAEFETLRLHMAQRKALRKSSSTQLGSSLETDKQHNRGEMATASTSRCVVTAKRTHSNDKHDDDKTKSKKHKKDHKHKKEKKHKHKSKGSRCVEDTDRRPTIHPGWSGILGSRR